MKRLRQENITHHKPHGAVDEKPVSSSRRREPTLNLSPVRVNPVVEQVLSVSQTFIATLFIIGFGDEMSGQTFLRVVCAEENRSRKKEKIKGENKNDIYMFWEENKEKYTYLKNPQ